MFKMFLALLGRTMTRIILVLLSAICVTGVSPVYRFAVPEPFSGPDIFNPYRNVLKKNGETLWKRALFHTHTMVKGIFNECHHTPAEVSDSLRGFGYDLITFSNHNSFTDLPAGSALDVNVYEHGWNLPKYHKLVFGAEKVWHWDNLMPVLASQRQFHIDMLSQGSDFVQINHPTRTWFTLKSTMEKLEGYTIMELDSGRTTAQEYWDWALSCGHYSFGMANDDLHFPDLTHKIAVRCNFLSTEGEDYEAVRKCLTEGGFYSMRIPDYGHGDWKVKHEMNRHQGDRARGQRNIHKTQRHSGQHCCDRAGRKAAGYILRLRLPALPVQRVGQLCEVDGILPGRGGDIFKSFRPLRLIIV